MATVRYYRLTAHSLDLQHGRPIESSSITVLALTVAL
jgi:hypothetical protein